MTRLPRFAIFWALMGAMLIYAIGAKFIERICRRSRIRARSHLSDDELYAEFYNTSEFPKTIIIRVWREVAELLHIDPGKLRPSDKITDFRSKIYQFQSDVDHLDTWVRMIRKGDNERAAPLYTIDDVIRFVSRSRRDIEGG